MSVEGDITSIKEAMETLRKYVLHLEKRIDELGAPGLRGAKGDTGERGQRGDSATLKGDKGERGEKGERGGPGPRGKDGPVGPQGKQGERGLTGDPYGRQNDALATAQAALDAVQRLENRLNVLARTSS
jgi:hypothetical protein